MLVLNKLDLVDEGARASLERQFARHERGVRGDPAVGAEVPYPFERIGAFELAEGLHQLVATRGPDPSMDLQLLPIESPGALGDRAVADRALRRLVAGPRPASPGDTIDVEGEPARLQLPEDGEVSFHLSVPRSGHYAVFTQHLPEDLDLRLLAPSGAPIQALAAITLVPSHEHDAAVTSVGLHNCSCATADPAVSSAVTDRGEG